VVTRPATLALDDQILAVLRDAEGFPVATADVVFGVFGVGARPGGDRALAVGRRLRALTDAGDVARETVAGMRSVYWRLAEPPAAEQERPCG
jgi:hypothetical protein